MAIGVNQVEYSPTSTTGWYAGISPPVSGYTVYVNKVTQGPSILVASNDNDLVSIARSQGATSTVTTTAGALNYFASQSDMMVVNKNYNDIVTSGLVMNWDASFVASYPVSGTTWYDISGSGNTGTLNNGPTFNSSGYFVFDGTDDSVSRTYNSTFNIRSGITLCALFRRNSIFTQLSDCFILSRPPAWYFYDEYNAGTIRGDVFIDGTRRGNRSVSMPNDGRWYEFVYTYDSSTGWAIMYRNGASASSTQVTGLSNYLIDSSNANFQSIFFNNVGKSYFVNNLKIYNRALSASEIQQNYYGGPIVTSGLTFAVDAGNLVSFQNGSGSTFSLVGSYTGTLKNGVSYTTGGGGSWVFDGSDDRIDLQQDAILNSTSVTVCAWVNLNSDGTRHIVLANWSGYALEVNSNASVVMYTQSSGSQVGATTGANAIIWGKWSFIVGVYDNNLSQISTYVDGILQATRPSTTSIQYNVSVRSISATQFGGGAVNGQVTFVYQYNRALSASEVVQNFNAQKRRFGF